MLACTLVVLVHCSLCNIYLVFLAFLAALAFHNSWSHIFHSTAWWFCVFQCCFSIRKMVLCYLVCVFNCFHLVPHFLVHILHPLMVLSFSGIIEPLPEWSNWCGSESSTLENDVYVWCYAVIVVHARNEWMNEWMIPAFSVAPSKAAQEVHIYPVHKPNNSWMFKKTNQNYSLYYLITVRLRHGRNPLVGHTDIPTFHKHKNISILQYFTTNIFYTRASFQNDNSLSYFL